MFAHALTLVSKRLSVQWPDSLPLMLSQGAIPQAKGRVAAAHDGDIAVRITSNPGGAPIHSQATGTLARRGGKEHQSHGVECVSHVRTPQGYRGPACVWNRR